MYTAHTWSRRTVAAATGLVAAAAAGCSSSTLPPLALDDGNAKLVAATVLITRGFIDAEVSLPTEGLPMPGPGVSLDPGTQPCSGGGTTTVATSGTTATIMYAQCRWTDLERVGRMTYTSTSEALTDSTVGTFDITDTIGTTSYAQSGGYAATDAIGPIEWTRRGAEFDIVVSSGGVTSEQRAITNFELDVKRVSSYPVQTDIETLHYDLDSTSLGGHIAVATTEPLHIWGSLETLEFDAFPGSGRLSITGAHQVRLLVNIHGDETSQLPAGQDQVELQLVSSTGEALGPSTWVSWRSLEAMVMHNPLP